MPHNSIAFIRLLHTSLYTGDLGLQAENWGRHEAEDEDDKSEEGGEAAGRVQGNGIVDGDDAQELLSEEEGGPDIPNKPYSAQGKQSERNQKAGDSVEARV